MKVQNTKLNLLGALLVILNIGQGIRASSPSTSSANVYGIENSRYYYLVKDDLSSLSFPKKDTQSEEDYEKELKKYRDGLVKDAKEETNLTNLASKEGTYQIFTRAFSSVLSLYQNQTILSVDDNILTAAGSVFFNEKTDNNSHIP